MPKKNYFVPEPDQKITARERLSAFRIAKDRAVDELSDMIDSVHGYWMLSPKEKARSRAIGKLLAMSDRDPTGYEVANKMGLINGEEENFGEV